MNKSLTFEIQFFIIRCYSNHYQATIAENIGIHICEALEAYEAKEYDKSIDALYPLRYSLIDIGGSHAQVSGFIPFEWN